jgi:uncharacterized NAD-dependent epimerase/dehydratase family protein
MKKTKEILLSGTNVTTMGRWQHRKAKAILTVGSGSECGKMAVAFEIHKELMSRGLNARLIATGQEGIKIAGRGLNIETIQGHSIAGTIENEIESVDRQGTDYIIVEGQGALTHQGCSGITMSLMHGVMPDAMVLCHHPARGSNDLERLIRLHEEVIRVFRPTKIVAVGMDSTGLTDEQSISEEKRLEVETGLPVIDTRRYGVRKLADALLEYFEHPGFAVIKQETMIRRTSFNT